MRKDRQLSSTNVVRDYLEREQSGWGSEEYDPDSIMHYWFDKKWLVKCNHRDKRRVMQLPPGDEKKVLLGIHTRHKSLADTPSVTDYDFLKQCYSAKRHLSEGDIPATIGHGTNAAGAPVMRSLDMESANGSALGPTGVELQGVLDEGSSLPTGGICPDDVNDDNANSYESVDSQTQGSTNQPPKLIIRDKEAPGYTSLSDRDAALQKPCCVRIGIIGATNSGKSTTLNALLRGRFLPTSSGTTTGHVICIKHNPSTPSGELYDTAQGPPKLLAEGKKAIWDKLNDLNKSRREASHSEATSNIAAPKLELRTYIPILKQQNIEVELYDTPGISEDKQSQIYKDAEQIQDKMDGLILILSQDTVGMEATSELLKKLRSKPSSLMSSERVIVLMNKYDLFFADSDDDDEDEIVNVQEEISKIAERINVPLERIECYSAKMAFEARQWQSNITLIKERRFDALKVIVRSIPEKAEEVDTLLAKRLPFGQYVEPLSRIAEDGSYLPKVETLIASIIPKLLVKSY